MPALGVSCDEVHPPPVPHALLGSAVSAQLVVGIDDRRFQSREQKGAKNDPELSIAGCYPKSARSSAPQSGLLRQQQVALPLPALLYSV